MFNFPTSNNIKKSEKMNSLSNKLKENAKEDGKEKKSIIKKGKMFESGANRLGKFNK